jgi:hypothetical protein
MSSFISDEEIKISIVKETQNLNNCLEKWYKTNLAPG